MLTVTRPIRRPSALGGWSKVRDTKPVERQAGDRCPWLLSYQGEGMLHPAFGEHPPLAGEMGLSKTVQAIAASELLAKRKNIARMPVIGLAR